MVSLLTLVFLLLFPQGDTGHLSGSVVDANGASIPGASAKLISQTTSQLREVATGDSGDFAFTLLPPGGYKLEVTANGFKTTVVEDVRISITQTTSLVVHLEAATVTGVVTINADTPLVQQESSQMGRVIEEQTIRQ